MNKKKRRKIAALVGRLGPATNLRPAGAHESLKKYNRRRAKAALRREATFNAASFSSTDLSVE